MATTKTLSIETKSKAINYVMSTKTALASQRTSLVDNWERYDTAWRAIFNQDYQSYKGDSTYASPQLHDNVETIISRIVESVRIDDNTFDISPANPQEKFKAELYKRIAVTQSKQQDIEDKKETVARVMTKYGTGIVKVPWLRDTEVISSRGIESSTVLDENGNPVLDETGKPIIEEQAVKNEEEVISYVGPGFQPITDLEDVYMDMFIQNIQDQPIVIHRMIVDWKEIDKKVKAGVYFKDTAEQIKDHPFNKSADTFSSRSENILGTTSTLLNQNKGARREYELFEAWCQFDIDNNGKEVPCVITVVNNQILGLRKNPFWHQQYPFLVCKYREVEGEAYGIGALQPVLDLWYEMNDTTNQVNDAKKFVLNPVVIYQQSTIADEQDFDVFPGAVWAERVPGTIRPFQQSMNEIIAGTEMITVQEARIDRGMGITPLLLGQGDVADFEDVTYRGTQKAANQADKKFRRVVKRFEYNIWRNWLEMGYKLNAQLLAEPFLFPGVIDPQTGQPTTIEIDMQQVVGEYAFIVSGVEYFFDLQDKLEKTIAFSQMTANKPWVNSMEVDKQIAEMMGLKDIDKIIIVPQPPPEAPSKPCSVNVSLDPSKGTGIALAAAQVLNQNGYQVDVNTILHESKIVNEAMPAQEMIQSGLLPQGVEEDLLEDKGPGEIDSSISKAAGKTKAATKK